MKSEGNYENNGKWSVQHCRLDDHENDGIIDTRVSLHSLLHLASHDE